MIKYLLLALLLPLGAYAQPQQCLVVGVSDGDTIKARCGTPGAYEQIKVRLGGIDAPESRQAFGQRSKQAELHCNKIDRYKRSVCTVMAAPNSAPDGPKTLDAGLAMVTQGMAWWYRAYSREQSPQERGQYEFAEFEARAKKAGLWADPEPVAPWEWRKELRN